MEPSAQKRPRNVVSIGKIAARMQRSEEDPAESATPEHANHEAPKRSQPVPGGIRPSSVGLGRLVSCQVEGH